MITTEIAGDSRSVIEILSLLDPTYQISCKKTCSGSTHICACPWYGMYMGIKITFNDQMKISHVEHLDRKGCRGLNHVMMTAIHSNYYENFPWNS